MRLALVIVGELICESVLVIQLAIFARDVFPVGAPERELAHAQLTEWASRVQSLPMIGRPLAWVLSWWDGVCNCPPHRLIWGAFAARTAGVLGLFALCLLIPLIAR